MSRTMPAGSGGATLGPPSPTSPTTPTTPSALVPASRDFLVPIGSTGALQKFSVANAAQKRKTAADRRAAAQQQSALAAAAEAGWSQQIPISSVPPAPPTRSASSLGINHQNPLLNPLHHPQQHPPSHHLSLNAGTPGFSRSGHQPPVGLAPIDVYHRSSSAIGFSTPRSATLAPTSIPPSPSAASTSSGILPSRPGPRMRTTSENAIHRPLPGGESYADPRSAAYRQFGAGGRGGQAGGPSGSATQMYPQHQTVPQPSHANHYPNEHSTSASPSSQEKKRTFSKGLRGLFSSNSIRKASTAMGGGGSSQGSSGSINNASLLQRQPSGNGFYPNNGQSGSYSSNSHSLSQQIQRQNSLQQQHYNTSSSSNWSSSNHSTNSPYSSGFSQTTTTDTSDLHPVSGHHNSTSPPANQKDRWSTVSGGSQWLSYQNMQPDPYGPRSAASESASNRQMTGPHPGRSSILGANAQARDRALAQPQDVPSHPLPPLPISKTQHERNHSTASELSATSSSAGKDPSKKSKLLQAISHKITNHSANGSSHDDASSPPPEPKTPKTASTSFSSKEPPQLEFNLPSPGIKFGDEETDSEMAEAAAAADRLVVAEHDYTDSRNSTHSGLGSSKDAQSKSKRNTEGSVLEDADRKTRNSHLTVDAAGATQKYQEQKRDSKAISVDSSLMSPSLLDPLTAASWLSSGASFNSDKSTPSMDFKPSATFGHHDGRSMGEGESTPRSASTPTPAAALTASTSVSTAPSTTAASSSTSSNLSSGEVDTSGDSSHRSSIMSNLSISTSIAAMTRGWQVEPDVNPPLHPSVLYGPASAASSAASQMGSTRSQGPIRTMSSSSSGFSYLSQESASSAPTTVGLTRIGTTASINRSNTSTPIGRTFQLNSISAENLNSPTSATSAPSTAGPTSAASTGSPNPLLAPLFESFGGSRPPRANGSDEESVGAFRSRQGSMDSGAHGTIGGHSTASALGITAPVGPASMTGGASSTIGHATLGHGAGTGGLGSGLDSAPSSTQGHASNWSTASAGHHLASNNAVLAAAAAASAAAASASSSTSRRPTSAGTGAAPPTGSGKKGRPTTPRGGSAASAEQAPSALRNTPVSHSREASLTGSPLTGATQRVTSPNGIDGPSDSFGGTPMAPSRSKDRPRPAVLMSSMNNVGSSSSSSAAQGGLNVPPGSEQAMLATLAKLESAKAGPTSSPFNLSTFSEAQLRDALANGGMLDLVGAGATGRERDRKAGLGVSEDESLDGGATTDSVGSGTNGKSHRTSSTSTAADGPSAVPVAKDRGVDGSDLAAQEARIIAEKSKPTPAMLNGVPVPEGADPKTYVPPNALTRTRRGAKVGKAALAAAEAAAAAASDKGKKKASGGSATKMTSPRLNLGRFSLDSDNSMGTAPSSHANTVDSAAARFSQDTPAGDVASPTASTPTPTAAKFASQDVDPTSTNTSGDTAVDEAAADGSVMTTRPDGEEDVEEEEDEDLSSVDSQGSEDEDDSDMMERANSRLSTIGSTPRGPTPIVDSQMPANAWSELEAALLRFRDDGTGASTASSSDSGSGAATPAAAAAAMASHDKGNLLRTILLPFLALEIETPTAEISGPSRFSDGKTRRALFFDWIRALLVELHQTQTSADRGAILESIGCVLESRNLAAKVLDKDEEDLEIFNSIFGVILGWAIGELNKKGVYQNTLIFTGRLLAIAFVRIPGVASKLLRALPVNRFALERVASEANWDLTQPRSFERYRKRFPAHLRDFCFQDARSYLSMLDGQTPAGLNDQEADDDRYLVRQEEVEVEMAGNWLRRWQSDDSELFFSFIRNYHRQLSTLLMSTKKLRKISKWYFGGPGYAHLATSIHQKCLSMVHREIFSVTTLSSQKTFNPGDTANVLSGSTAGKPRHLEAANRRCTTIVVEIARAGVPGAQLFSGMLIVHVKSVVKRTSLYDAEGVFCLLDWLDGLMSHMDAADLPIDQLLDIDFLIDMLSMLLNTADHALALMRTIAFCYSNFGVLTASKETRLRFCERILLEPSVFHKLFLSWSVTIRAYFLHLLVFRLARISDFSNPKGDTQGRTAIRVAKLFNQRLDEIRLRYEELSPPAPVDAGEDDLDDFSRFKNRPASFVSTIKHTPSIHRPETMSKAERILGIGVPDPALTKAGPEPGKGQSLAGKWLRGLGSKKKKNRWNGPKATTLGVTDADSPQVHNEPRRKMTPLDELDLDDDDVDFSDADMDDAAFGGGEGVQGADSVSDARAMAPVQGAELVPDPDIGLGDNITPDASFDLQSATPTLAAGPGRPGVSPRVSRAFSKRSSILPGPAFNLVGEDGDEDAPPVPPVPSTLQNPYEQSLHTYAVQSLTEYERTIQEHDQYFAAQPESEKAQVPRLQVNWPAMWQD